MYLLKKCNVLPLTQDAISLVFIDVLKYNIKCITVLHEPTRVGTEKFKLYLCANRPTEFLYVSNNILGPKFWSLLLMNVMFYF